MKILIASQYFYPENFRINDLAFTMAERGHQVTVLTGIPNYPTGQFFDGYGLFRHRHEIFKGVEIIRAPLIPRGNASGWRLALNYLSFAFLACWVGLTKVRGDYDAIFVFQVSPITVGIPAVLMKWLKKAPIFFWVLDLWPESVTAVGGIKQPWLISVLTKLTKWIYSHCDLVLVQSKGFYAHSLKMGVPQDRLKYFPNWAESLYQPMQASVEHLPNMPNGFRVMFAGNIGVAQDFPSILDAVEKLKHLKEIQWIIVGDGRMQVWVREQVAKRSLQDVVHILGRHPIEKMPELFARVDALLVTLKKEAIFASTIPGKVQSYLACGKPIIGMLDGEGAHVVQESGAGFVCPSEDSSSLATIVEKLYLLPQDARDAMGAAGRKYYELNFDKELLFSRLDAWMYDLVKDNKK